MPKALKTVGKVLGVVASIAAIIPGPWTPFVPFALAASAAMNAAGTALTKPSAKNQIAAGALTQVLIMPNAPRPYPMGEGHYAGVQRHREGYGGTVDGVPNPYWFEVNVYSGVGPVQSITPQIDFDTVPAWYSGYLTTDTQLGAMPEASALTASYGTPGRWTASHMLSGHAAISWNYKFDKDGKKFAGGFPLTGAYGQWVKVYDPRLDSTFPGGSGSHRLDDETTWEWSENPALHAGTYAYGRYANGKKVMGVGLPVEGIDFAAIAAWANVCDANGWIIFGVAYEGFPDDDRIRWANLTEICAAGSGEPCFAGAVLSFRYDAPSIALDTITEADIYGAKSVTFMQTYRGRVNTVIPNRVNPDQNWELTPDEAVQEPVYLAEDGEERREVLPLNMVKDKDQAAQLAAYRIVNSRELAPIRIVGMPRLRNFRPGDCLHLDIPTLGLDHDAILLERGPIDPQTMTRELVFRTESEGKHDYALGVEGAEPPTPGLVQTSQERDETAAGAADKQIAIEVPGVKNFSADYLGNVTAPPLPAYVLPAVTIGGQDIRASDTVGYALDTSGVTATVNDTDGDPDKGLIEITAVDAIDGWIDLTVTVGGVEYPPKRIVIQRRDGMVTGLGGPGTKVIADNSFFPATTGSYDAITDVLTVTVGSGESLYGTAPLTYIPLSAGDGVATAKWQYSPIGAGTWTDFGTGISGSTAGMDPYGGIVSGSGVFTHSASPAAGDYDVRLVALFTGTSTGLAFFGAATMEARA
jgi:hypothetical protein